MYKKITAAIAATVMITALFASLGTAGATETSVTASPDKVKANTRVLLTFSVTNGTGENIDNVLIRPETGTFTEVIGGQQTADNLVLAADNLENATTPLKRAGENLKLVPDNLSASGDYLVYVGENLQIDYDDWQDDRVQSGTSSTDSDAAENVGLLIRTAGSRIKDAGQLLSDGSVNFTRVADNLNSAGAKFIQASADGNDENLDNWYDTGPVLTGVDNVGDSLKNAKSNLKGGDINAAENNLEDAVDNISAFSDNFYDSDVKTAFQNVESALDSARAQLDAVDAHLADAGANLKDVEASLVTAATKLSDADDNLIPAANNLDNVGENIYAAGEYLRGSDNFLRAGDNLAQAAENLSTTATELGKVLGGDALSDFVTDENAAAENLKSISAINFTTAGEKLVSASSYLGTAAGTMRTTANDLAPADWTLTEGTPDDNDAFFSAIGENYMAPGASEDFTFVWKSGTADTTFTIWGYKVGADIDSQTFGPIDVTVGVDSTKPGVSVTVMQEGVAENNIVGTTYDNGKATLKITASEVLDNIGPITIQDKDNLLPPITRSDLTTADNEVFTYEFPVGEWDDNSLVEVSIDSATDLYGNENTSLDNGEFYVDTRAPVIIDNAIRVSEDLDLETKVQAGSGYTYLVDNSASKTLTGRVEDNWTAGTRLGYDNVSIPEVITVDILWDGESITAPPTPADNFSEDITLPEGLTSKLMVKATDWTGNSENQYLENIFIDTMKPSASFDSLSSEAKGTLTWDENKKLTNDSTPKISLTISDAGLGVAQENLMVYLDNDENIYNDSNPFGITYTGTPGGLENSGTYEWDATAGEETFENTIENNGSGLNDGKYWINVRVSDNIFHDTENHWVYSQSFKIDTAVPAAPSDFAGIGANTTRANPRELLNDEEIVVEGTTDPDATVTIFVNDSKVPEVTAGADGDWTADVSLSDGLNEIEVTATDAAGNTTDKELYGFIDLTIDRTAPTVKLTAPESGITTGKKVVTVSGSVNDDVTKKSNIELYVNNERKYTGANGEFSVNLALKEGTNTISVVAKDEAGNVSPAKTRTVEKTVPAPSAWPMYATIGAIIAIILAAIAIIRRES